MERRLVEAPASLRERILDAVRSYGLGNREKGKGKSTAKVGDDPTFPVSRFPFPSFLREVADALVEEAQSAPPSRSTALTLLAADALVTLACEAVAESDPAQLAEMR